MTAGKRAALYFILFFIIFPGTQSASAKDAGRKKRYSPEELPAWIHPTVKGPVPDLLNLEVPPELKTSPLAVWGLLDVTSPPFSADPTGRKDATGALQAAIDFAADHQMACYFPGGVYLVSDTLRCTQRPYRRSVGRISGGRRFPCVLFGSRIHGEGQPARPVILLAPNSPGFDNANKPKYVIHFMANTLGDINDRKTPQPNISMNQLLVNIDIKIGEGNSGAVGVRHRAAQGSGVQECTIDARGALCGLEGGAGSGGGHFSIKIIGGRTGMDLRETQPASTISDITLIEQTGVPLLYSGRQSLSAVGIKITVSGHGPAVEGRGNNWSPNDGEICLVDSVIELKNLPRGAPSIAFKSDRSIYLNNVFVSGAEHAVSAAGNYEQGFENPGRGWLRILEYARGMEGPVYKRKWRYLPSIYLNGKRSENAVVRTKKDSAPPEDLQSRHRCPPPPDFLDPMAANVKLPPYGAKGDGKNDDTDALQQAIDENDYVFIPKGIYRVTKTITLHERSCVFGVGQGFSIIMAGECKYFGDNSKPKPVILTDDSADATTMLAFVGIFTPPDIPGCTALEWRAGRNSTVRSMEIIHQPLHGFAKAGRFSYQLNAPAVLITGSGGGRWYNFFHESSRMQAASYRHILVNGTRQPLRFYQLNAEHARSEADAEIRGARYVSIFGLKGESNQPILLVKNSDHIRLFGYGGNAAALPGKSLFIVENTPNFLLANLVDSPRLSGEGSRKSAFGIGVDPDKWWMVTERPSGGGEICSEPLGRPVLFKRGEPRGAK